MNVRFVYGLWFMVYGNDLLSVHYVVQFAINIIVE